MNKPFSEYISKGASDRIEALGTGRAGCTLVGRWV